MKGVKKMPEWLWFVMILAGYLTLMKWILPAMGVST
jgi:hypothetical protein